MNNTVFAIEPGQQDIVMTREFDAPLDLVFKVMTDPDLVPRWWGPRGHTTKVDEMEARRGGAWRYLDSDPNGNVAAFRGVYHEVASERTVTTFEFEGMPGHVGLVTTTLEDIGGRTRLTEVSLFPSVADRDGTVAMGMQAGASETMDRLEELLATAGVSS